MAGALSNPPLSIFPCSRALATRLPRALATRLPSRTLTLALPQNHRIHYSSQFARNSFKASLKASGTDSKIINGDDAVDQKILPTTMKALIQAYKKAILDGDEESACEMESAICVIENEKNILSQKCTEITAEVVSGKDKFLRLKADLENFRKRVEKDRSTLTSDIQSEVVESLLPMVDGFERAKQQIKPETEKEKKIDTSYQGIYKQFVDTLRSLHVSVVETVGKPFDPSMHEAIGREESEQFKEGIVVQEIRRGFFLGGQLIRPATVKVSSGLGPRKSPPASEGPEEAAGSVEGPMPTYSSS